MDSPYLFGDFDVAELCLILFFAFFLWLVFYLRREDRREGYPLEDDISGRLEPQGGFLFNPSPKAFLLPHGHGVRYAPRPNDRDTRPLAARRSAPMDGAPIEPLGDAGTDGVGPGAWVERPDYPDETLEHAHRIVPARLTPDITVSVLDADPRGFTAVGSDGRAAGTVTELWVDRAELLIRYLEVDVAGRRVLLPQNMAVIDKARRQVKTNSIRADQFAGAPVTASPDSVTLREEDKIVGYFGAGYLYASPDRQEPWI